MTAPTAAGAGSWLSDKAIAPGDRLIVALDVPTAAEALELVDLLGGHGSFYKIGMELLAGGDFFPLLRTLHERGKKVFVDLKFFDVPATVASAVRGMARHPATFCTIHGNDGMVRAAVANKGHLKLLAVTALTSLDRHDLDEMGFACEPRDLVLSRARAALAAGCDGVVSSGLEAADLRAELGPRLLVVCPGIRPVLNDDDQKRTVDVRQAFLNGADHIVVGRPIREAADPRAACAAIQSTIVGLFDRAGTAP